VSLLSWAGTFLHLKHDLDKAKEVLQQSAALDNTNAEIWLVRKRRLKRTIEQLVWIDGIGHLVMLCPNFLWYFMTERNKLVYVWIAMSLRMPVVYLIKRWSLSPHHHTFISGGEKIGMGEVS